MRSSPDEPGTRRLLLVDCDAFYVQVARLEDPEGAGKARLLIVGGSPDGRGVVTSASYEARRFGVRSAMPTAHALRLCPEATVAPVRRSACLARSRAVREVLKELSPVVQAASIDEFYLDLSGTERLFAAESLEQTAWRIRDEVEARTRIAVSIGGGTRKIIAKLAASRAKPAGVHIVAPGCELEFMRTLTLGDVPGVGPALLESLKRRGLVSVKDALEVQPEWLREWFGEGRGTWLYNRIRGLDSSPVDPHEGRKSISSERTFFRDLSEDEDLERRLFELAGGTASTLRRKGLRARTVTVKLRDSDFRTRQHSRTLSEAVESDHAIRDVALELLRELREQRRTPARLLGVGLSGFVSQDASSQLALFETDDQPETEKDRTISRAVDTLRERFGSRAVRPGRIVHEDSERKTER